MMVRVLFTFLYLCSVIQALSQDIPLAVMDQVESFLEEQEQEADLIQIIDKLNSLYLNPQNINRLDYADLQDLRLLNDIQINDLLAHRTKFGDLIALEELQSIPSFSIVDASRIKPFLKVGDDQRINLSLPKMYAQSQHELYLKWGQTVQQKDGFRKDESGQSAYLGDKNKYFLRYRSNYENRLKVGMIIEKDEGEQLFADTINQGLDYVTAHIHLKDYSSLIKDVIVGDYTFAMGQGLIAHNNFGAGKSAWTTSIKKGGRVLKSYNSVNENAYFRGLATTLGISRNIDLSLFYSQVDRDGNANVDTLNNDTPDIFFSSLLTTGNHRTLAEKEDKSRLGLSTYGGIATYKWDELELSLNHMSTSFSDSLIRSPEPYNLFRFNGDQLSNTSLDFNYRYKNVNIFGETSYSSTKGIANITGFLIGLDRQLSLAVSYRYYDKSYNALQPNAFGESSLVSNEEGIYIGMDLAFNRKWKLRAFADFYRHPWLRSRVASPSVGQEYLARLDFYIKRKLLVYLQYNYESKQTNLSVPDVETKLPYVGFQVRQKLRLHLNNKVSKYLELRTRCELVRIHSIEGISWGQMIFQDFIYKPIESPLSFTARFALFDTDDFDSRIYAFENSILYEFSIPAYNGIGFRYYLNLRYDVTRNLTAEFRFARTYRSDSFVGSGREAILGFNKTDLKAQLRYVF